jgi:GT2 family glycosyltransferase
MIKQNLESLPLVTVFTLIYNTNPDYVIEAIESVRANSYPNIQHIIIDDCSPNPEPKNVVKKWVKKVNYQCEFYDHEINYGICKTLNHVLSLAKGKYILGCSDDILTVDRIKEDVKILEKVGERYALVFGMSQIIDNLSRLKYQVIPNIIDIPNDDNYFSILLENNIISAPSVTIRVDAIKQVGGYDESLPYEDYDMWLRLSLEGFKFAPNPRINCYYRKHAESMTSIFTQYRIEEFKIKLKFSHLDEVKECLKNEIIHLGYSDRLLNNQLYKYYKEVYGSEFILTISSLNLNGKFKSKLMKAIFYINKLTWH